MNKVTLPLDCLIVEKVQEFHVNCKPKTGEEDEGKAELKRRSHFFSFIRVRPSRDASVGNLFL